MLFVDFSKAFDSLHREKLAEILTAYGVPKETVDAVMMLYKDTKSMVRSPDGDTDFFHIHAGVLQGDTLAPFLFIIALDYVLRTSIDPHNNLGFTLKQARSRRHPAKLITDADYD
ncbi:Hypp9511 [Branchiostoma lanceolatum]|uniref:Hypp9511 protein n=1 Tax=Branchiostoma lanceolatum TaxID=7740 RepID=A0A8S4MNV9_BRALA|nr:Hypp9511 [Branchiostoma lanceolatum]